jgi:hypothetical protein
MPRKKYDCLKCPGYCCSYPVIEVKDRDAARIARHFDLPLEKAEKKFFKSSHGYKRVMRRKKDKYYGRICQFFDTEARRCTIYEARPWPAAIFPARTIAAIGTSSLSSGMPRKTRPMSRPPITSRDDGIHRPREACSVFA